MSVYSGFSTRSLESIYNHCICSLISVMQQFISNIIKSQNSLNCESFSQDFYKNYSKLKKLEKQKHLQPNFSLYLRDLDNCLQNKGLKPGKPNDKESPFDPQRTLNSSIGYFERKSDFINKTMKKAQSPGSSLGKNREEFKVRRESPKFFSRDRHIKVYQDRILKSIIKELSNNS